MMINRFKCNGAADGSNSYGVSFDVKPTDSGSTFLPTKVTATVALWYEKAGRKFNFVLQKIGQDGTVAGEYTLGSADDSQGKSATYSTVSFKVPSEAAASPSTWRLVIKVANGYANGRNLALGNVTMEGALQGGQAIKTHSVKTLITPANAGTITLVFAEADATIKIDGTKYTSSGDGIITVDLAAGDHAITKADSANLFYMVFTESGAPVSKYLAGDADCDGEVKMNDVVLIMQVVSNNDRYGVGGTAEKPITEQGLENADVSGNMNGLSVMDALAVQRYLLELLPSLPEV